MRLARNEYRILVASRITDESVTSIHEAFVVDDEA
jgi:hypothetical protein